MTDPTNTPEESKPGSPIFYGWFIVATGMLAYALGYGSRYSFSVFFPSLLQEFKWPRDVTAAILSFHILTYGFASPIAGYLVDRVGPRISMSLGVVLLSAGLALSHWGTQLWHFYLTFGVLSGTGLCFFGSVPFTTIIRNWFERRRGLAFSLLSFGTGGAYVSYPAVAGLIHHIGWRATFWVEAAIVSGLLLPPIILLIRYHPREKGLRRDGLREEETPPGNSVEKTRSAPNPIRVTDEWTFPGVLKNLRFWMLALTAFSLWGVMDHIMTTHHIAFAMDVGYSKVYASSVLSLFGYFRSTGALLGLISDRIGREPTITIGAGIGISAILVLLNVEDTSHPWMLYYYASALGFAIGICSPTLSASIADIVQGPKVGLVIGLIWSSFSMGGTVGPWLGGRLFEINGNYRIAFLVAIAMFITACLAIWIAAPRKFRRAYGS